MGGEVADLARAVESVGTTVTNEAVELARAIDPSVPTTVELVNDRPADAILRAAEACEAMAVVVGAAGRGPVSGTLLGSATYQVVHRSPVPVVVVPLVAPA
jgi:nucleotide-binding universal stress UspA family protein